jgi:T5SS/PEP-CTERM-associated repeat protein
VTPLFDVLPTDDIFTELIDEGLPLGGNFPDATEPVDAQTHWERNTDIIVGQKSFGRLDIDGNSILNFADLIIGDEGDLGGQTRQGTGFVLITGIGAKYNNDPNILPPGVPANFGSTAATARPDDEGFNLYVGRAGFGTLEILGGGHAEIQNLTVIGDMENSEGELLVDGFASFLQTGGFEESGGPIGQTQQMTIGRLGSGKMTISAGGTVLSQVAQAGAASNDIDATAAVIGGELFSDDIPEAGGVGIVTVTGPTSRWILLGTLQVGGFHDTGSGAFEVPSGEDAQYDDTIGVGTLNVYDGALVTIRPAIDADPEEDELRLLIGRKGTVNLNGGYINIGSPGQVDGRQDNIALVNDGVIIGGGRIDTGLFRNRFFGEIRVNAGQKLLVHATSEFINPMQDLAPMINWGLIEVIGTPEARAEIEFERALTTTEGGPVQPFLNAALDTQPLIGRGVGQITVANATLRFRSGLSNQGKLSFTAGDNLIVGPVVNNAAIPADMIPAGEIAVAGNNTTVTFEDEFVNNGLFDVFPNASLVLFVNNFTQGAFGTSLFTLGGRPSGEEVGFASVLGDIILDGGLTVDLFAGSSGAFNPMADDQYQIMATLGLVSGKFNQLDLPLLPPGLFWTIDYAGGVTLMVVDGTMIIGADFNGDGIIDNADFAIWFANVGITMGASPAQGDADGDGDVDGDDFLIWQHSVPPGAGSGAIVASGQNLPGTVPEPTALVLLVSGGMIGLALRRRRAA